ncbi:PREDICTED: malate dehydrogenase, mitochondrial-like [Polistes canadensis]|uniref:malate dehydrogenase, mitochondrial-like n=1 Tax=Polistes canadensis TaxID=91411 RepID=UPI000718D7C5|nr:PREDICTED: malate dehydrogenase, mitochondrial-like [Polistes canadensis]
MTIRMRTLEKEIDEDINMRIKRKQDGIRLADLLTRLNSETSSSSSLASEARAAISLLNRDYKYLNTPRSEVTVFIRGFGQSNILLSKSMKVAILGANNETGRFLSLLLKRSSLIDEISLYDKETTEYLASELNHVDTRCKVTTYPHNEECLTRTLQDAKVVVALAGKNLQGESTPTELLESNAEILSDLLPNVIRSCPRAMLAIAMYPVNSLVPVAVEMYKKAGIYECKRLFGVTTLDCVRANSLAAEMTGIAPECVVVPVIGGCCPCTRIPLFSQMTPRVNLSMQEMKNLTNSVRKADEDVLKANCGRNVSIYASAFAIGRFCISLCKSVRQQRGVIECAYVRSCVIPEVTYFASQLELGPDGIQKYLGIPPLNNDECKLLLEAIPVLREAINQGETLALGSKSISSEKCPVYPDTRGNCSNLICDIYSNCGWKCHERNGPFGNRFEQRSYVKRLVDDARWVP